MKTAWLIVCAIFASTFAAACEGGDPPPTPKDFTIKVWVQDDPDLKPDDVIQGCSVWSVEGVTCELVEKETEGEVRVYAYRPSACEKGSDGYILGQASYGGEIDLSITCLLEAGPFFQYEAREVVGHEVGHQIGIWSHIPEVCDGKEPVHPDGERVCGTALMNPEYHPSINYVTHLDELAFDLRSKGSSVIGLVGASPAFSPACVYLKRE